MGKTLNNLKFSTVNYTKKFLDRHVLITFFDVIVVVLMYYCLNPSPTLSSYSDHSPILIMKRLL